MMNILGNLPNRLAAAAPAVYDAAALPEDVFYQRHVLLNKPCLIKGAVRAWRAARFWHEPGYLASRVGRPAVALYRHSNYLHQELMAKSEQQVALDDAVLQLQANRDGVVSVPSIFFTAGGPFAPLLDDLDEFPFLRQLPDPLISPRHRVFLYSGAGTAWHYHEADETLMCQIKGSKRVGLLAPLNPAFDRLEPDLMRYRYLESGACFDAYREHVQPCEVVVEEGDCLYIPPYWWHGVEPTDTRFGITLAQCWGSPRHKLAAFQVPIVRRTWIGALLGHRRSARLVLRHGAPALAARLWFRLSQRRHDGIQ
ncbi:hypothetical protein GJ700_09745 [Duganella sp. FT92W]|uniref:JmjC domain-containing protein n=1 Tax=Pseudoduganella rivuli TaxID=2666085 RepID=A0A7X2ILE1_9BURK|nr:cupin-like domain-containing protein [Pseudoduganella rivuli]MRV71994.1 hypothetical protein [Pseudoduganella rivuli]